ncbi:hypothetical protein PVK06_034920 [Gossypium arboreum]|uniref:Uncharacterized protein n=1 Tax=Gossypium arboreum TaxID=29729 RepID=A0ABR0NFI8_GOSAR|nr:hypothetical protein PVK06_034920 [Gossypium arboreum]
MPEKVNKNIYPSRSSNYTKKPSLQEFILSPQVVLVEADMNRRLQERLTFVEKEVEKLHEEIVSKRADKCVLEVTIKSMDEQHKVTMANLVKSHEEALEKYKRKTMQSFQDYLPDLKHNFLLHT